MTSYLTYDMTREPNATRRYACCYAENAGRARTVDIPAQAHTGGKRPQWTADRTERAGYHFTPN